MQDMSSVGKQSSHSAIPRDGQDLPLLIFINVSGIKDGTRSWNAKHPPMLCYPISNTARSSKRLRQEKGNKSLGLNPSLSTATGAVDDDAFDEMTGD